MVFLYQILEAALFQKLLLVFLHVKADAGPTAKGLALVLVDGEAAPGTGRPAVLLVFVVLTADNDFVGDKVGGVETDTELTDHTDIGAGAKGFHERFGS